MVMQLYLIRHGVAAERGPEYPDDSKRPLTSQGMAAMKREAKALNELDVSFDVIITSPLVRTRQTAEILADALADRPPVATSHSLTPEGTPEDVLHELQKHRRKRNIALVGHEPNIGQLAGRLLGTHAPIEFKKGAICRIDFDELPPRGVGHVRWFLPPRVLKKIS